MKYTKEELKDYILNFNPRMRGSSLTKDEREKISKLMIEALMIIDKDWMKYQLQEFLLKGDK